MDENSKTSYLLVKPQTIKTRQDLHIIVRRLCKEEKISLKRLSKDYRRISEKSLKELLKIQTLNSDHVDAVDYFCRHVPGYYRQCSGNHTSIMKRHADFFKEPLFAVVDASYENVSDILQNTE